MRKFAVNYGGYAYLIEARDRIEAASLFEDEARSLDGFTSRIAWDASVTPLWRAAWKRGAVVVVKDRNLPEGVE